jgi:hypothetical protein
MVAFSPLFMVTVVHLFLFKYCMSDHTVVHVYTYLKLLPGLVTYFTLSYSHRRTS